MPLNIYNPTGPVLKGIKSFKWAARPSELVEKKIGFVNTSKVNADQFLKRIEERFYEYGIGGSINIKKLTPGMTLNKEQLRQMKNNVSAAVIAFGD